MLFKSIKCPNCDTYHDPTLQKCPSCHKDNELFRINRLPKRVLFLHPYAQIGLFLVGFAYVGMRLAELLFSVFLSSIPSDNKLFQTTLTLMLTYSTMFIALGAIVLLTRKKELNSKFTSGTDYIYGVAYAVTLVCVGTIISALISLIYRAGDNVNQTTAIDIAKNYPIPAFFLFAFLGPICEELTYRVGLYSFFRRINKYLAFAVTAIIFAFIHFNFDAENMLDELWSIPMYIVSGFVLTLAYEHRGPACSMTAHVLYNMFAFVLILTQK